MQGSGVQALGLRIGASGFRFGALGGLRASHLKNQGYDQGKPGFCWLRGFRV